MRLLLAILLLLPFGLHGATVFTEFYVKNSGNVMNGGSDTNDAPKCFLTGGFWTNATGVFRKDASTFTNVAVGDFASVYPDGTGTNVFTALVTNVTSTNIWMSLVAKTGTSPANDTAGATSIRVGGAWAGPNTNSASLTNTIFPFNFVAYTMTNAPNVFPRVNFYNDSIYSISNTMLHAAAGPILFQGMTSTPGDFGKATFDGSSPAASYVMLTASGINNSYSDLVFQNNGTASGTGDGIDNTGAENIFTRIVIHDTYRAGIRMGASSKLIECELYSCVKGNASTYGAIYPNGDNGMILRCYVHDNTGANVSGLQSNYPYPVINSIFIGNTRGATISAAGGNTIIGCDFYNNSTYGIDFSASAASPVYIENCNFIKNGTFGISSSGTSIRNWFLVNCAFGSGTMTNSSGSISVNATNISALNTITYTADTTPWVAPANGNFTIATGAAAKAAGRGLFTQSTVNSPTNTVSFPDIGAAQSASTNAAAAGGTTAHTFAQ